MAFVLEVWCCVVKQSCYARRHNDLEGHSNLSRHVPIYSVLGTSLLWRSTMAFTYLKVKSSKCLWPFVYFRWSWSCYFVLVLVLRIWLVLFTSLDIEAIINRNIHWSVLSSVHHHRWYLTSFYVILQEKTSPKISCMLIDSRCLKISSQEAEAVVSNATKCPSLISMTLKCELNVIKVPHWKWYRWLRRMWFPVSV